MSDRPAIALLGADEPLGSEILRLIEERDLEVGLIYPLTLAESDGCVTVMGAEEPLIAAGEFEWRQAAIVVSASRSAEAAALEAAATGVGLRVAGAGQAEDADSPLAAVLARVLSPVERDFGLDSVDVTAILPVASFGQQGINELVEETRALFAMESRESELLAVPIAFNLVPQSGASETLKDSTLELDTIAALRSRLGKAELAVTVTALWAPVFYGVSISLHVGLSSDAGLDALQACLARAEGVVLMDSDLPGVVPTPVTDAQESEAVFAGRLRLAGNQPRRAALWLVADMARLEAAKIVDSLEKLIEK